MYAQACQDLFAYLLNNKMPGFFLDIGAGDGFSLPNHGNTKFLEENGWTGILIEGNPEYYRSGKNIRTSTFVNAMIPDVSILEILDKHNAPKTIDYVSMDIEPSTLIALENFPFEKYDFKILTFEHDMYVGGNEQKIASHKILNKLGYVCLCDNVENPMNTGPFEDWWINPKYFSDSFIQKNKSVGQIGKDIIANIGV